MLPPENRALVVPKTDEDGYASVLAQLLGDGALRQALSASNRNWVQENYSDKKMFDAYEAVFAECLNN